MKLRSCILPFAVLSSLPATSHALENITFIPSLSYQDKDLSFDQSYSGAASNNAKFSVHLPVINAGFTIAAGKFFASLKFEKNFSDTSTSTDETDRSRTIQSNLITHPGGTVDVSRQDISLTFGYNFWKSANVFVGYLNGKTELRPDPFCANPIPSVSDEFDTDAPEVTVCSRSNRSFQQFFIGDNPGQEVPPFYHVENQEQYKQDYSEKGFYLGMSYGFNINDIGTLSVSFAYADMDGKYKDNANDPSEIFTNEDGAFRAFNYKGDSSGTSLAVTWTSPLSEHAAYTLDLRRQAYSMEGTDESGGLSNVTLNTDEEMVGLTAGIQLYF
ncbi:MAG: hypothetical protein K6L80_11430 [Agarilytica sp.]